MKKDLYKNPTQSSAGLAGSFAASGETLRYTAVLNTAPHPSSSVPAAAVVDDDSGVTAELHATSVFIAVVAGSGVDGVGAAIATTTVYCSCRNF